MANLIRGNDEIKSILSPSGRAIKLSQYANDTVLILSDLVHSIPKALETIGTYCAASCMKLNVDKTEGMLLGLNSTIPNLGKQLNNITKVKIKWCKKE